MRCVVAPVSRWSVALLLVCVVRISPADAIVDAESCWNDSDACLIQATLHRVDEPPQSTGLAVQIDCQTRTAGESSRAPAYLLRPLESLLLDGCHTPLDVDTYGMEYLPYCGTVPQVYMERFHADTLQPFSCPAANNSVLEVEILRFHNNELATIGTGAFVNLPRLRELYFAGNTLRHIARSAFDTLRVVERIYIAHEPLLALKDGDLFERTGVADLQLMHLKYITSDLFGHLPETLRQIVVTRTAFDDDTVVVSNSQLLRNISINDCTLKSFTLLESAQTTSVRYINLSGNALNAFRVDFLSDGSNASIVAVETLDLSENQLTQLPLLWLSELRKLRHLLLRGNRLKMLSLPPLMSAIPALTSLDLRDNELTSLHDAAAVAALSWEQVRIQIDRNPWHCLWLLDFAHTHPEKFRVFQYAKYISQINVNGLQCVPVEVPATADNVTESVPTVYEITTAQGPTMVRGIQIHGRNTGVVNASTYKLIYGGPWDTKRSQRAEALIIVFMLPVGVALLFLLLYMWINCQRVFHLSYYRSFGWSQRNIGRRFTSAERFDVVRQLPPTANAFNDNTNNNEDYETPLNGIGSVCNCNNIGAATYANEKCSKPHHITYEELPTEQPYKIYEEIIGDDGTDTETYAQPFYDHLSYTQPAKSDVADST
uniref:Leucine-rich repeat-containing protein 15 n=1 Tax=Bactrocera latifrons TaxID=174628 RepID=A0A0K8UZG4_BACLA